MALTFNNSAPKAALDAITALLAGGDFQLRASATPLADLLFQTSGGAFGAGTSANPSVAVSTTIADDTTPIAGTIDNFRLTNAGGTAIISGSVGTSGSDLNVTNNVIPSGATSVSCPGGLTLSLQLS